MPARRKQSRVRRRSSHPASFCYNCKSELLLLAARPRHRLRVGRARRRIGVAHRKIGVDDPIFFASFGRYQKIGLSAAAKLDAFARIVCVGFRRQREGEEQTAPSGSWTFTNSCILASAHFFAASFAFVVNSSSLIFPIPPASFFISSSCSSPSHLASFPD